MRKVTLLLTLTLISSNCFAAKPALAKKCSVDMARFVEEELSRIRTWRAFSELYTNYQVCDRSALSYAFTERVTILTQDPDGLSDLERLTRSNKTLRKAVLRHLASEAVPAERVEKILDTVNSRCPADVKMLCKEIGGAVAPAK